jgi:hypothetical protein
MKKFIFISLIGLFSAAAFAYAVAPAPASRFAAQPVAEVYPQCVFVPEGTNNAANAPCYADLTAVAYDNTGNVASSAPTRVYIMPPTPTPTPTPIPTPTPTPTATPTPTPKPCNNPTGRKRKNC